jgi:hypothetical protein
VKRAATVSIFACSLLGATAAHAQVSPPFAGPPSARTSAPVIAANPAPSAAFAACSETYYRALEPLRTGRGAVLAGLHRALRTPDPELPGKWQISAPPTGKQKPPPKPERVCVETKESPGRAPRCIRFETKQPVIPPDIVARLPATPEEARVLKSIGDFIEAKGALPDVGNNGRHNFLVQRIAQDIRLYATQPQHPNLCAGSTEIIEFYSGQAAPLKKRYDEVTAIAKQAKDLAAVRVRAIAVAEVKIYDKAAAEAAKVEDQRVKLLEAHAAALAKAVEAAAALPVGTTPQAPPSAPTLPVVPPVPPRPNGPAQATDYAVVSLTSLLSEALRPLLPMAKVKEIADEPLPTKAFVKARAALLDPETPASPAAPEVKDAATMALRLLEARVYGDLYVARFKDLDVALSSTLADLRKAQSTSCTCRE